MREYSDSSDSDDDILYMKPKEPKEEAKELNSMHPHKISHMILSDDSDLEHQEIIQKVDKLISKALTICKIWSETV